MAPCVRPAGLYPAYLGEFALHRGGNRRTNARKPWTSEDPRRSLFDAAALAITYFVAMGEQDGPA